MSRSVPRALSGLAASLVVLVALAGCGDGSGAAASSPSVDPTAAQLQAQLDELPQVDGATRSARDLRGATLTETFAVPAGTPACLQVLAQLDAGGYEVQTTDGVALVPSTCRTATGAPGADTSAGTATILARGGSQVGLTWTATSYTLTVTAS